MKIYINKKEIQAIRNAWEQVNSDLDLEAYMDEDRVNDMKETLKRLNSIDIKYKK
jgi:hypothetical protein